MFSDSAGRGWVGDGLCCAIKMVRGDTGKNSTGRITEIEGGGRQEIGRQEK